MFMLPLKGYVLQHQVIGGEKANFEERARKDMEVKGLTVTDLKPMEL